MYYDGEEVYVHLKELVSIFVHSGIGDPFIHVSGKGREAVQCCGHRSGEAALGAHEAFDSSAVHLPAEVLRREPGWGCGQRACWYEVRTGESDERAHILTFVATDALNFDTLKGHDTRRLCTRHCTTSCAEQHVVDPLILYSFVTLFLCSFVPLFLIFFLFFFFSSSFLLLFLFCFFFSLFFFVLLFFLFFFSFLKHGFSSLCSSLFFFVLLCSFFFLLFFFFLVRLPMSSALHPRFSSDRVEPLYIIRMPTCSCLPLAFIFKSSTSVRLHEGVAEKEGAL